MKIKNLRNGLLSSSIALVGLLGGMILFTTSVRAQVENKSKSYDVEIQQKESDNAEKVCLQLNSLDQNSGTLNISTLIFDYKGNNPGEWTADLNPFLFANLPKITLTGETTSGDDGKGKLSAEATVEGRNYTLQGEERGNESCPSGNIPKQLFGVDIPQPME